MSRILLSLSAVALAALTHVFPRHQGGVIVQPGGVPAMAVPSEGLFDPGRDAVKDISAGVELARKQHKHVLLDVGGNWCPWCIKLDGAFHRETEIAKILREKYVVVKVNFSPENENKAVLSKYPKIEGYPHLFVLDGKGKLLHSEDTGLLESGDHHDPAKVVAFLKEWAPKQGL